MASLSIQRPSDPSKDSFLFVDNVRFAAMCALFIEHALISVESASIGTPVKTEAMMLSLVKLGSIAFFLASGFLLGSSLDRESTLTYMKKRLRRVFLPWLFWFSCFTAVITYLNVHHARTPMVVGVNAWSIVCKWGNFALLSSYWFVPNLLFALCCLLVVRRFVGEKMSGLVWFAASLFYAANIYLHWLPVGHQQAWLGFVFYLWLGTLCARHHKEVAKMLDRVSYPVLLSVAAVAWLAAIGELTLIQHLFPRDSGANSLRITNQVYSLCIVALIAKPRRRRLSPNFVDVRSDTFGLYLLQPIVLYASIVLLAKLIHLGVIRTGGSVAAHLFLWTFWSALVYFVALVVVKAIAASTPLRWIIGLTPGPERKQQTIAFPGPKSVQTTSRGRPASAGLPAA